MRERPYQCLLFTFVTSFYYQDLLELAETLGPARPQGLAQEGTYII